ncbi:hypothetical protein [Caballeronia novacaledonica]|uniref:hypothetical protein n=1 Tax=Caballeronia novacaledonica TaxID=1544861 RepID=UPI001FE8E7C6|nr:hypothetical protein [Caballeronia novacaledonica]
MSLCQVATSIDDATAGADAPGGLEAAAGADALDGLEAAAGALLPLAAELSVLDPPPPLHAPIIATASVTPAAATKVRNRIFIACSPA